MIICARSLAKTTLHVERRQTCDHLVKTSIKIIKQRNDPHGGWIDPHVPPCSPSKKIGDSNMILVKNGPTLNLLCKQASHEYSLDKRISCFFSGCSCECSII